MSVIGVLLVVAAIGKWLWEKRRGGGGGGGQGGANGILWALLLGAALSAPGIIIPIFLTVLDFIANAVVNLWNTTSGSS